MINSTLFDNENAGNCISDVLDFKIFSACVIGTGEAVGLNRAGVRVLLALKILFVTFYNKATRFN